ncbi:MAG TPA: AbrB/MazE/SpoVT family DNA-binding domain-containing protein [Verrucomicrobiae bacterium]|nr:AbrB/MazE/SpoVT family DNA-binding domain-containing protein [Verrucomicrobiae bacterium]
MKARIQKWGNSLALRLPKSVAQQIEVGEGDAVELEIGKEGLLIRPSCREYDLSELIREITKANRHNESDWGKRAGKEAW